MSTDINWNKADKLTICGVLIASLVAITGLVALVYGRLFSFESTAVYFQVAPAVHATLNTATTICISLGLWAIFHHKKSMHQMCMVLALLCSAVFLVSYIVYHAVHGDTPYMGTGILRPIYFFILISHILLSVIALPYILTTVALALRQRYSLHKKLARITAPLWLYVSITGVLIYLFLKLA